VWRQVSWDDNKNRENRVKHGLDFADAATALRDPLAVIHEDHEHSINEARYIVTGTTGDGQWVMVVITELDLDTARIISARRLERRERHAYENHSR
jgi:uncharacterized DUF497 family protein